MKRREFLAAFVGMAAWPLDAGAQQLRQVIGFLHQGSLPQPSWTAAFRKGLVEAGVTDGLTIPIEDRAADGQYDRLPALAEDLVNRQVSVIAADFLQCGHDRSGILGYCVGAARSNSSSSPLPRATESSGGCGGRSRV